MKIVWCSKVTNEKNLLIPRKFDESMNIANIVFAIVCQNHKGRLAICNEDK